MNISEAARRSGLSSKTIRYYEDIGLTAPVDRTENGYRVYEDGAVEELKFLSRARDVGFDLSECRQLLGLHRIDSLLAMQQVLRDMASRCHGDEGPDCAILNDLASADESSL
jgi:MerR family copper efflux transcriptional regulator